MITAPKTRYLIVSAFLLQIVFSRAALAHFETAKLFPSDANAGDSFGASVAIDGNIAVVGAYLDDSNGSDCGAVYVYELSGSQWIERQKLAALDGSPGDQFGRSVAIDGNTIVVGSYYGDSNEPNTGSTYVFSRLGGAWTQQQKLIAPDAAPIDRFGCSVSIDNNTIVIGAYGDDSYTGSAYVFVRTGSNWIFQQKLNAPDANAHDYFGYSVAIDNNTIIIGAPNWHTPIGSAYFYQRQSTTWFEQNVLRGDAGHFGFSVALDGNSAVIGAYEDDTNIVSGAGTAYVFANIDVGWVKQQKLFDANSPACGEDFGWAVAIKNDTILAGCINDSVNGKQAGAVFEFVRTGSTWVQSDRLTAGDANTDDKFGTSLALSGRHIIIGAPYNANNGKSTGSSYLLDNFPGDLDADGDVDFFDFAVLAGYWLQNNPLADIAPEPAGDGIVDIKDLAVLCDNWLAGK
ncbi:MAG: hypothetical protein ABSG22_03285 [Sedimentisphaerales bacterium]|jgi:hypothetical protein